MKRLDPILLLLTALVVFFSVLLVYCEHLFAKDGQVFQVFANVLSGFGGALLMRVKPAKQGEDGSEVAAEQQ